MLKLSDEQNSGKLKENEGEEKNNREKDLLEFGEYMDRIYKVLIFMTILIVISLALSGFSIYSWLNMPEEESLSIDDISKSISSQINEEFSPRFNELDDKLEDISDSLWLESEDHFLEVMDEVNKSVVAIAGCPAKSNETDLATVLYTDKLGEECAIGTGFSVGAEGQILTAAHIINEADRVLVILNNGTEIPVNKELIDFSPSTDLALLNIKTNIPPVDLYESGWLPVGSAIGFIGFPLGTEIETKTVGVVSAIGYYNFYEGNNAPVYVIHSQVNHGNSGGPVFSMKTGKIIGVINHGPGGTIGVAICSAINEGTITWTYL